ncbi:MAG: hypothetical protein HFF05_02935 [Oscillospiraceae bacterium]|nr:hypothetical protein [Oscillospiraceae bacterium]
MKRKIGLLALTLTAATVLAGCSTSSMEPSPSAPAVAPTPEASPNTVTRGVQRATQDVEDKVEDILDDAGRTVRNADDQLRDYMR